MSELPQPNSEPFFPDTYREILTVRPSIKAPGDEHEPYDWCDNLCCLALSPIVICIWTSLCIGTTAKKISKCCFKYSISTDVNENNIVINEQPKK